MYKVVRIFDLLSITTVITLAGGSGSFFTLFSKILNNPKVFYNTLLLPEIDKRLGADSNYPLSGLNLTKIDIHEILYKDKLTLGCTDILNNSFLDKIENILISENVNLITIYAESMTGTFNFGFIETYLPLVEWSLIKHLIIKIFHDENLIKLLITTCEQQNLLIGLVKPLSSHPNNKELYVFFSNSKSSLLKKIC